MKGVQLELALLSNRDRAVNIQAAAERALEDAEKDSKCLHSRINMQRYVDTLQYIIDNLEQIR